MGAADQISSEQVYEAVLSTKSRLSNPARRKSQSSSIDPHQRRRDTSSPSHVRIYVQNIEGSPGGYHKHDCTHPRKGLMRFPTALWCQSTSVVGGPQHQSLYNDSYTEKDGTICHTECMHMHTGISRRAYDERWKRATHDSTVRLTHGTRYALLQSN